MRENAATRAEETIARREAQAKAKITAAENALVAELRQKASELAISAAQQVITDKLDSKAS
ncbi:MAG: ATP synthase F0 subunit B, partial [Candidatus Puniceispirillaceae bacterium]